jgi:hypothetical protein
MPTESSVSPVLTSVAKVPPDGSTTVTSSRQSFSSGSTSAVQPWPRQTSYSTPLPLDVEPVPAEAGVGIARTAATTGMTSRRDGRM